MSKMLEYLYDCFYEPPQMTEYKQTVDDCHKVLCKALGKSEREMLLQLIDAKDSIADKTAQDSFNAGFQLSWQLSHELNTYKNERIATHEAKWPGARFIFTGEDPK